VQHLFFDLLVVLLNEATLLSQLDLYTSNHIVMLRDTLGRSGSMTALKCDKCKELMRKKGVLIMSNSKYEVYVCPHCGYDKKVCLGVIR